MATEMRTTRVHRTWLDKLLRWQRAYETKILYGHHEVVGRGPRPEASQAAAEQRLLAEWNNRSWLHTIAVRIERGDKDFHGPLS
jgi:hypothetical protein